jgi:hypothetical protein
MTTKRSKEGITEGQEGNIIRKLIFFRKQNLLMISLPNEQTKKLGFTKGDYIKVTNDGKKMTLEKIDV